MIFQFMMLAGLVLFIYFTIEFIIGVIRPDSVKTPFDENDDD